MKKLGIRRLDATSSHLVIKEEEEEKEELSRGRRVDVGPFIHLYRSRRLRRRRPPPKILAEASFFH
jgi:hypothetical protein